MDTSPHCNPHRPLEHPTSPTPELCKVKIVNKRFHEGPSPNHPQIVSAVVSEFSPLTKPGLAESRQRQVFHEKSVPLCPGYSALSVPSLMFVRKLIRARVGCKLYKAMLPV